MNMKMGIVRLHALDDAYYRVELSLSFLFDSHLRYQAKALLRYATIAPLPI